MDVVTFSETLISRDLLISRMRGYRTPLKNFRSLDKTSTCPIANNSAWTGMVHLWMTSNNPAAVAKGDLPLSHCLQIMGIICDLPSFLRPCDVDIHPTGGLH